MIFKESMKIFREATPSETGKKTDFDLDYDDDDSVNYAVQTSPKDKVQATFDEIITKICNKTLDLRNGNSRAVFLADYSHVLDERTRVDRQTFLHIVASRLAHSTAIRFVVRRKGHLLQYKDANERTPLHVAIVYGNLAFVDAILKEVNSAELDILLRQASENGQNCVHAAIHHFLDHDYTLKLVEEASNTTLSARDKNGLTPLHLAGEYHRSSASQLSLVKALIARGDAALDQFTIDPPGLSVYEYHRYTREKALIGHQGAKAGSSAEILAGNFGNQSTLVGGRRALDELPVNQNTARQQQQLEKCDQRQEPRTDMSPEIQSYADSIQQEIKLYYLRSTFESAPERNIRDQLSATRFLYGANIQNVNLSFDFSQGPLTISQDSFEDSYRHMVFDEVLRYVSFRPVLLQKPPGPAPGSRLAKKLAQTMKEDQGPNDLVFFFNWLYRKNVRHILKVVVHDTEDAPHSEKAIADCLSRFEIETLSWRKVDLSSQTLFNACRGLKEVYLRWSGTPSILKAWTEQDGLLRLEKLECVHLVWNKEEGPEAFHKVNSAVEYLQSRLNQAVEEINAARRTITKNSSIVEPRKPIVVRKSEIGVSPSKRQKDTASPANMSIDLRKRRIQPNRWLDCIDRFADELQNVKVPATDTLVLKENIKVAVIDDGVDVHIESLQGKVIGGESFDRTYLDGNGTSPYYISGGGHGTMMADMICRVCPTARLYVCKLEMHPDPDGGGRQISAESAALAVMAAVRQKVDIISMSWTVQETDDNQSSIIALQDAIRAALDAKILLFGAASDKGAVTEIEYPCSFDRRIFRIGASTADGRVYGPSGNPQHLSFIFPGHKISPRSPYLEKGLPIDSEEKSGSSISNALAAGLAALVLHCIRLGVIQAEIETKLTGRCSSTAVRLSDLGKARDFYGMRSIFRGMGLNEDNQRYIEVWKRLDGPARRLRSPSGEIVDMTGLEIIAGLARDLVSGIADR
ncbi:hypothetical protein AtubIFM57143_010187 [Aspergillus tubingensis]|nr:hypothetical protein AtubIFM57143_010187 [Aspergillus tubingensis]